MRQLQSSLIAGKLSPALSLTRACVGTDYKSLPCTPYLRMLTLQLILSFKVPILQCFNSPMFQFSKVSILQCFNSPRFQFSKVSFFATSRSHLCATVTRVRWYVSGCAVYSTYSRGATHITWEAWHYSQVGCLVINHISLHPFPCDQPQHITRRTVPMNQRFHAREAEVVNNHDL